jgi:hypothetical protein
MVVFNERTTYMNGCRRTSRCSGRALRPEIGCILQRDFMREL